VLSTAGASVLGVGYLLPLCYFVYSMLYGKQASANPWGAKGLEWETTSPPPTYNFDYPVVVDEEAYEFDRSARTVAAREEVQSA
jgi:cytochrome c oxidase subunit 1